MQEIASGERKPLENSYCLAWFTVAALQILLYMITLKRSSHCIWMDSTVNEWGSSIIAKNVSVISDGVFQAAQAVFFPTPKELGCCVISTKCMEERKRAESGGA